jgi:phage terminase large subunit-like protein
MAGLGPIGLVGQTKADVRDVMIEAGPASIMHISPPNFIPEYEPSKRRLTWPNGILGHIYSGDEPGQLRGPQHATIWADELAKYKYPEETWDNIEFGLRVGEDPRACVTTTPKPIAIIKAMTKDPEVYLTRGSSYENIVNLSKRYVRRIIRKYEGTRLGKQELEGIILGEIEGALWSRDDIENGRWQEKMPELYRIGVAIDPAASSSGETGITVGGVAWFFDKKKQEQVLHGFLLDDLTVSGSPAFWAKAVISGYNKYKADFIIGEINNGGEMVENTIRSVEGGREVNYRPISASKGKQTRAEPIQALYEQRRIHHVGFFGDLEDQLTSWVPGDEKSPDRLDAMVWLFTALMLDTGASSADVEDLGEVEDYKPRWR